MSGDTGGETAAKAARSSREGVHGTNTARVWPVSSLSLVPADTLEVFDVRGKDRRTPELQACRTKAQAAVSPEAVGGGGGGGGGATLLSLPYALEHRHERPSPVRSPAPCAFNRPHA